MSLWGQVKGRYLGTRSTRILLFFLQLLIFSHSTCQHKQETKVHQKMSESELRLIFQVSNQHEVPDYELIHIHSRRYRRSIDDNSDHIHQVAFKAFGRSFELDLTKNVHLVPNNRPLEVFFADKMGNSTHYRQTTMDNDDFGEVYQDEKNEAALFLYQDYSDDSYLMDGTIGHDLVIKPAPFSVKKFVDKSASGIHSTIPLRWSEYNIHPEVNNNTKVEPDSDDILPMDYAFLDEYENTDDLEVRYQIKKRSVEDTTCRNCFKPGIHIVYKRKKQESHHSDYGMMETEQLPHFNFRKKHRRKKRQAPFMIFPEILVIVDYDGYRLHGEDNVAIKRYVISFWNGVDLRYKLLKGPSVKISIAGIIISRGRDATPYLERNRVGRDAIDAASALTDMGKYLFLERRLPVYDIAVAITKLDMCRRKTRQGDCNRGTAGFAYVGGACVVNKRLEKVNSVAIVEDTGGFSGIIVAAHELGHLLGAVHDGSPPPSYLGGPGAVKCRWEDGFIMSDLRHTSKGFKWSICTVRQFHHFLNGETATCMYNSPHEEESLPRVLPGKLLSLDAQCRKDRGTSACFKDDRVCAQLFCFDAGSGYCVSYRPAAEGSRCGDKQMCLNGKCMSEHENAIDYGDGFLRRTGTALVDTKYQESPAVQSTTRTWWNQITTPSTTSSTKIPWWKRLQQQNNKQKSTTTLSTTTLGTTRTTTIPTETVNPFTMSPTPHHPSTSYPSTSQRTVFKSKSNAVSLKSAIGSADTCEDRISNIAGSMSCKAFLRSFAYQYCRHKYIKKNCCASHHRFCSGSTHGR